MRAFSHLFFSFLVILFAISCSDAFTRNDFPEEFLFGAATSAYQVRRLSLKFQRTLLYLKFDCSVFCYSGKERLMKTEGLQASGILSPTLNSLMLSEIKIADNRGNGDIACDGYHKYKEDVKLMAEMGLEAFRFSISWTRLIPSNTSSSGIKPHVTLYHYDLPQSLEDEYGGWINRKIIKDFTAFADVCFREFGDDVKLWTTINEANIFAIASYSEGFAPPGHCSPTSFFNCSTGNSSTEPYLAGHNMLLAHASASKLYKLEYKSKQRGSIGLSIYAFGLTPYSNSKEDEIATQRAKDFLFGWMLKPLVFGDYPDAMKRVWGSRLPVFSEEESEKVKGSSDFVGIIHYTTVYVRNSTSTTPSLIPRRQDFFTDMGAETICKIYFLFHSSMDQNMASWFLLFKLRHEKTGTPMKHSSTLQDTPRIEYIQAYIGAVLNAIK
ncbi:hypothetical protein YC2023_062487 [Brassica napus]